MKQIVYYKTITDKIPYLEWYNSLDNSQKILVIKRLKRLQLGNYGVLKKLSNELSELKFDNGLRIYFTEFDNILVILLTAGGKKRQSNDIEKALEYLKDYKERFSNEHKK